MLNWMDLEDISFNSMLLLEKVQLSWLKKSNLSREDFAIALKYNPVVYWYIVNKCPSIDEFITGVLNETRGMEVVSEKRVREAELSVMRTLEDWLVYVIDPKIYDNQPFLNWDSKELTEVADFKDKTVLDIGAGTGRLSFVAAKTAKTVYCVEPVNNLRDYLKQKSKKLGFDNVYVVDGVIEHIPFNSNFADVIMAGHVVGDNVKTEVKELLRVVKSNGQIILCPGNGDKDNDTHNYLVQKGFSWSRFKQPRDGWKRKYWLNLS